MATTIDQSEGFDRRSEVRDMLARYPHVSQAELGNLLLWFRKEATALEVALLASEPSMTRPYERFKAEHLDRLSGAELFWSATFVVLVLSILVMVAWSAA